MSDSSYPRIAVVGGGLTGLSAAHRLLELAESANRPADITLYEANDRVGGLFGTRTIDGYTIETGADSFITNKPWGIDLCRRLRLDDQVIGTNQAYRRSLILHEGRPVPTPEGFDLLVPRKLRALLSSPFLSPVGNASVAAEAFVPPRTDGADESLASFVRRRLGQEALDRLIQPMVGGIYTSDPEKLSMLATIPRFVEMEREHGSLLKAVWKERASSSAPSTADQVPSGARYSLFASLAGGMSDLLNALDERVRNGGSMHLGTRVDAVHPAASGGYVLETADGGEHRFDAAILALPSYVTAKLVSGWDAGLAELLGEIEYASSAIVVSGHRLADIAHPLDAFGLVIPHVEGRRILAVSFLSRKFPGRAPDGHIVLRTFVGGAMQPELLDRSDEELIALVRGELEEILGVTGEPTLAVVARYERAMPQYHVGPSRPGSPPSKRHRRDIWRWESPATPTTASASPTASTAASRQRRASFTR